MKNLIQRYSAVLLAGTILASAALPQAPVGAKSLEQIHPQPTLDRGTSNSSKSLPALVARRVKREVARTFKIPVSQLQIADAQPRTWNGCFGLPAPNAFCTMIAVPGWQVIVTGQQRTWVYHTNQNGSKLQLNKAASLVDRPAQVQVGFLESAPDYQENVVFQAMTQGGIANRTTLTKLTADGIITQQTIAPNIRSTPVVIKRLTRDQVNTFLEQVRQQRFNHLNGLRYFSDRGADFDMTQLSADNTVVEYANPLQNQLPAELQGVIETWQKLLRS